MDKNEQTLDTQVEAVETESENVGNEVDGQEEAKTFTQNEVDEIVKNRLQREKAKQDKVREEQEAELERQRLEEEGQYKELLEQVQAENEKLKSDMANAERKSEITTQLISKGLDSTQVDRYSIYVDSLIASGLELNEAVDQVANDYKVAQQNSYANPRSSLGGDTPKAEPADREELGREAFRRLRG